MFGSIISKKPYRLFVEQRVQAVRVDVVVLE